MCDIWIRKYEPKSIREIIGNKNIINLINEKINNFNNEDFSSFIISGYHGVGKSIITKLILKENNYEIKNLSYKDDKVTDLFNDMINYCKCDKMTFDENNNKNKFALIINDIEKITLKNEKARIKELVKINNKDKLFPIFFISNIQHNKLLIDILEMSYDIKIKQPNDKDLLLFINKILENENIIIHDNNIKMNIIKFSQYDIRRLISILYDLKNSFSENEITDENFNMYLHTSNKKIKDTSLFDATQILLDNFTSIDGTLSCYKVDKVLVPLTIHENFPRGLISKKYSNYELLNSFKHISNSISLGDVIETNIYTDQNWFLHDIHGFFTCTKTSYYVNKYSNNKKKNSYQLKFSSDLNQTSLKNINRKQITNLQKIIPNKTISDIIGLNKIMYNLVLNENIDKIYEIIKCYDKNVKIVENLIKIDKTLNKILISQKNKKKFNNLVKVNK